jgi:prepilin-type N-terminal cleavage/methylation domain-containing protein
MKSLRNPGPTKGFTLIELMITVTILAVLAVVAVASYKRYMFRAQSAEGKDILMEIKMKQEHYFSTYSQYITSGSESAIYPIVNTLGEGGKKIKNMWSWRNLNCDTNTTLPDVAWCHLGFKSNREGFFRVSTVGWTLGTSAKPSGSSHPFVQKMDATRRWYYAFAHADLDADGKYSTFVMHSQSQSIVSEDEIE